MSNYLARQVTPLRRDERGQLAIAVVLVLPVIAIFFALAFDAGLWYFDHRTAQNQADAAVLAAVQFLPVSATDPNDPQYLLAVDEVNKFLTKNGSDPALELGCGASGRPSPEFMDLHPSAGGVPVGDGLYDAVRVCVRRPSPSIFSSLSVPSVWVSAAAMARVGPVQSIANVMPWALVPDDVSCDTPETMCQADMDGDGVVCDVATCGYDEDCGWFPPAPLGGPADAPLCPYGLSEDKLWVFKSADPITPGNFAPIQACGFGNVNYMACIEGQPADEFYESGGEVNVAVQGGNLGTNTDTALSNRYADEPGGNHAAGIYACDVESTPMPMSAWDADGHKRAKATYIPGNFYQEGLDTYDYDPAGFCEDRLVVVPVIDHFPPPAQVRTWW